MQQKNPYLSCKTQSKKNKMLLIIETVTIAIFAALYAAVTTIAPSPAFLHPLRLALEAAIVGAGLVLIFSILHVIYMKVHGDKAMMDHKLLALQVFLAGALFHGIWEITTGNDMYCKARA